LSSFLRSIAGIFHSSVELFKNECSYDTTDGRVLQ
jgi:hypothetical protein